MVLVAADVWSLGTFIQFYTGLFGIGKSFRNERLLWLHVRPGRSMSSGFQKALKILISPRGAYEQRSILVHIAIKVINKRERLLKLITPLRPRIPGTKLFQAAARCRGGCGCCSKQLVTGCS